MFSKTKIETSMKDIYAKIEEAEAIVIGAGAGLSSAAGYEYAGERFKKYFRRKIWYSRYVFRRLLSL